MNKFYQIGASVLLTLIVLAGCGGGGSSSSGGSSSKDLFSNWTEQETGFNLNLSGMNFGSNTPMDFWFEDGSICTCLATLGGDQSSGSGALSQCSYNIGTGQGIDPGCNLLVGGFTYTKTGNTITFCDSDGCANYI